MIDIFDTKKRFAVNVKSEQEAYDFLEWVESRGVETYGLIENVHESWVRYGQTLCYSVELLNYSKKYRISWCHKDWYKQEGCTVIEADKVLGFCEELSSSCEVSNDLTDFLIGIMRGGSTGKERKRACCNCGNNKRVTTESGHCDCFCSIDGHYIGYIECFEGWCRRWRKGRKFDGNEK